MDFYYLCEGFSGMEPPTWMGIITPLLPFDPVEFEVRARGSRFHLILGTHTYGTYLYVINLGIGIDIKHLTSYQENLEQLLEQHPRLRLADAVSIAGALAAIQKQYQMD